MTSSWREMTLAAALAIGFSAHAHNCDPLVFLSLKVGSKTIAVTEAQLSALPQRVIVTSTNWAKKGSYKGPYLNDVYKGFPTFASNTSAWVDRAAIDPGSVCSLASDQLPAACVQCANASWQTVRTA